MLRYRLDCELIDEAVLTARSATAGAHRSLTYLPGAVFLGAAAARLYGRLSAADAFVLFHSGKVRFGGAAPCSASGTTRPLPLCLHERKSEPADETMLQADRVYNFIHPAARDDCRRGGGQPRQLRDGWLCDSGRVLKLKPAYRMKTAIDAASGRAAEGQLFGYQSLPVGTRFAGELHFDADVPASLREQVLAALAGVQRIGRSRSAQYGRARCSLAELPPAPAAPGGDGRRLVLWLLSDLAASSAGVPTFAPSLQDFGLALNGQLDLSASFVRTRSYTPYNSHRRLPDLERQLIVAGSVLCYGLDAPASAADLAHFARGIGDWRECGLGQVAVNPPLLATPQPQFAAAAVALSAPAADAPAPDHPLLRWLGAVGSTQATEQKLDEWVRKQLAEWALRQHSARRFNGLDDFTAAGPSRTQWGVVKAAGTDARSDGAQLGAALFDTETAICRGAEDWGRKLGPGWPEEDLRAWLRQAIEELVTEAGADASGAVNVGLGVARLADAIQKALIDGLYHRILQESEHGG